MKKIIRGIFVVSFLLCIICQNQSLHANATDVQAVETHSINAQLLYYDIEMDDYNTKTTTSIYCTCDECEAQRYTSSSERTLFSYLLDKLLGFIIAVIAIILIVLGSSFGN